MAESVIIYMLLGYYSWLTCQQISLCYFSVAAGHGGAVLKLLYTRLGSLTMHHIFLNWAHILFVQNIIC